MDEQLDLGLEVEFTDKGRWWNAAWAAVITEARTGAPFTIYDAARRHGVGQPPNPQADWGSLTSRMAADRLITPVGWTHGHRPTTNASGVRVWRGTAAIRRAGVA